MDEETLSHLFDPYYQGDTSHASKGLGLGLAIAQTIAQAHRGHIRAESAQGEVKFGRHGLARNYEHDLIARSDESLTYELVSSADTRARPLEQTS